uniref:Uncharacterized protein n=1 Tax=Anguilla anguilla TaxID=7936 RepID=A0A0E9Q279_ANGAN
MLKALLSLDKGLSCSSRKGLNIGCVFFDAPPPPPGPAHHLSHYLRIVTQLPLIYQCEH